MNDDELKRLWQTQKLNTPAKLSPDDQIKLMRRKMKALERAFRWVDAVIIGLSSVFVLFFAWTFLETLSLVARIGLLIMIAGLALDIWKPIRTRRRSPQPLADAPVTVWLRHELEKVHAQSKLKRTMLVWELLPFWIGMTVFCLGLNMDRWTRIGFSAILTGGFLIIYLSRWKLNQYTWRKADLPLIEELESLLQSGQSTTEPRE